MKIKLRKKFEIGILLIGLSLLANCGLNTKGQKIQTHTNPHKALLILDVQEDFTGKDARMPVDSQQAGAMIKNINNLIIKGKAANVLIVYIKNRFSKNDIIANIFRNNAAVVGSKGIGFDKRLMVVNENVFYKNQTDAFSNPEFEKFLISNNVSELLMTGVFADQCVFWTSKGTLNRGYKVEYIRDAVAAKTSKTIDRAVIRIQKAGATIKTTDSAGIIWI